MQRRALLASLLCPAAARGQAARTPVVATFSILADMVGEVGGDAVAVSSLVPAGIDVHGFQPRPADLRGIRDARVLVENGLGFEGWAARLVDASGFTGTRVVAAQDASPLMVGEGGRAVADPHVWQDPRRAVTMVDAVAAGLAAADPARADAYRDRAAAYRERIEAADRWIERRLSGIPPARRRILTSHDAFAYYGARYDVRFRGIQGVSMHAEPSPRDLARLAAQVRSEGVRVVFAESMADPRLAAALAREGGARVGARVYSDSLSEPGGPAATYLDMMRHNTGLFAAAMEAG